MFVKLIAQMRGLGRQLTIAPDYLTGENFFGDDGTGIHPKWNEIYLW